MGYGFGHRISIGSMPIVSASSAPAPEPTIWKVALYSSDSPTINQEYIWDGTTLVEGKPKYFGGLNENYIRSLDPEWYVWNVGSELYDYGSEDLITWFGNEVVGPPTASVSYSQNSYIQTVVLAGSDSQQSGTYTWDGTTFIDGKPKYMGPLKSGAPENNYIYYNSGDGVYLLFGYKVSNDEMITLSYSADLASNWDLSEGASEPIVSNIIYTA